MSDLTALPAVLFGGGTGIRPLLERWDAAVRAPLPGVRRVAVLSLEPGIGTTTVVRHVARVAAQARPGRVLAVDATPTMTLARAWQAAPATPLRAVPRTSAEAMRPLATGPAGVRVLAPAAAVTDAVGAWLNDAAPVTRFFDVAVTDFGVRHPAVDLAACAAVGDVVCLVADARRAPAELAVSVGAGLRALPERPDVVIALVDRTRTAGEAPRTVAAHAGTGVVPVPVDPALARDAAPRRLASRTALLRLTAALIEGGER